MTINTLFIDLDDTLYDRGNGLWEAIRDRMGQYMHECIGLPKSDVPAIRRHYFKTYGTTLRGLQLHYHIDTDEYLTYVHDLPVSDFIKPDPILKTLLSELPQTKWILTNANSEHAQRVLKVLGVKEHFQGIIDIRAMDFHCKPDPKAYQIAMKIAAQSDAAQCLYMDDSPSNLAPAKAMGMTTVLIGDAPSSPVAHIVIPRIHDLKQAFPDLWDHKLVS
ncbi:MAG: pyrimidine 5'-nucleotidase [Anaerolineales bacterium]|nr:pyrimidine 5'-nucleotidase [Anaerolineales bacterium]